MKNEKINSILTHIYQNFKNEELVDNILKSSIGENEVHSLCAGYPSIMTALAAYQEVFNYEDIDDLIHKYVVKAIDVFKRKGTINISLYSGLTGFAMSIFLTSRNRLKYNKLMDTFNNIIISETHKFLDIIENDITNIKESHYELIQGITGQLAYLINFKDNEEIKRLIKRGLKYLVNIISKDNQGVPKYLITVDNIYLESDKEYYKNGFLNQGVSHGISGPLVILALALKEEIEVDGQVEAIKDTLNFMKEFCYSDNENTWWYGRVKKEEFINKENFKVTNRASWCYGTPGIARSIYIASDIIGDTEMKELALNALKGLCKMDKSKYNLMSPTICHGYAGILMILDTMYKETRDIEFKYGIDRLIDLLLEEYTEGFEFGFIDTDYDLVDINKIVKTKDLGLLEGSIGVIITLLSVINSTDMNWKRIFLIN